VVGDAPVEPPLNLNLLPRPDAPVQMRSPVQRVNEQVIALNAAALPFIERSAATGKLPDSAAEPVKTLLMKYKDLSESALVRAFPTLRDEVSNGLDRLTAVASEAANARQSLTNSASMTESEVDQQLVKWQSLRGEERSRLIFGLASLTTEQRESLQQQAELRALIEEIAESVRSRLVVGEFQKAARMLEVAMLFGSGDESLESYKSVLELRE